MQEDLTVKTECGIEFVYHETSGGDEFFARLESNKRVVSGSTQNWPALDALMARERWQQVLVELADDWHAEVAQLYPEYCPECGAELLINGSCGAGCVR